MPSRIYKNITTKNAPFSGAFIFIIFYLKRAKPMSTAPPRSFDVFFIPSVSVIHKMISATKIAIIRVSFFIIKTPEQIIRYIYYILFQK